MGVKNERRLQPYNANRPEKNENFAKTAANIDRFSKPIHRAVLRDRRLDWASRGLFCFVWDLPSGWVLNVEHLVKMSPGGHYAIRGVIKRLKKIGALRDEKIRDLKTGRLKGTMLIVVDPKFWAIESPLKIETLDSSAEKRIHRPSVNPELGKPNAKVQQAGKDLQLEAAEASEVQPTIKKINAATSYKNKSTNKTFSVLHNMDCWNDDDRKAAAQLAESFPSDSLQIVIDILLKAKKKPLPGLVLNKLRELEAANQRKEKAKYEAILDEPLVIDEAAQKKGQEIRERIRKKQGVGENQP
ncbi:MAG: hypothetical protein WC710_07340 [Gallionella sp.]